MLNTAEFSKIKAAQLQAFDLLSSPSAWTQAKAPHATKNVQVGIRTLGFRDTELINSYGIEAVIITMKYKDVPGIEKFDKLDINGSRYTVQQVFPAMLNAEQLFSKMIAKGR